MANKEDLRVQRTKKALAEAFMSLLSTKPFDDITINELCDVAGVRRATFYKHYKDKHDFLAAYTRSLRADFDETLDPIYTAKQAKEYCVAYAKAAVDYINSHEAAVNNLIKSGLFSYAIAIIIEQNCKDSLARLRKGVEAGLKLPASAEVTAGMLAGGVFNSVVSWVLGGKKTSPEEFANQIGAVVSAVLGE